VVPGGLFLARRGTQAHGRDYLDAAIDAGACAVLAEGEAPGVDARRGVPVVVVPSLQGLAGDLAHRFYGAPSEALWVAGVTGTNGKTSVCHFTAQVLQALEPAPAGVLGTLGHGLAGQLGEPSHTTPDVIEVHRWLARFAAAGVARVVMEASSHGLDQGRVAAVRMAAAAFTNLTRDHLDYHGTLEAYAAAKRRLFDAPGLTHAVVNLDDPEGRGIAAALPAGLQVLGYSARGDAAARLRCLQARPGPGGLALRLAADGVEVAVETPLVGDFNVANLLAAAGLALAAGHPPQAALAALAAVRAVPGRMERFGGSAGPAAVVDYAHTPDALAQALETLRRQFPGRITCVFGCGGERDRGKRPQMGAVAGRLADRVILTDDNPRGEDPEAILADIRAGLAGAPVEVVRPRAEAIARALGQARPGDAVLVAGKGHEAYQEVAGVRHPYSDRATAARLLGQEAPC
jgi:UDP-N-acetylmuramoyl-L-alanyl-D-glutamate--2,6-diaminopimelate ligase